MQVFRLRRSNKELLVEPVYERWQKRVASLQP